MPTTKTLPTPVDPHEFIAGVAHPQRRADALVLMEMMESVTGHPGTMWGPSIIGSDSYHYRYDSGHEGDAAMIGFSPRASSLSLYGLTNAPRAPELLEKLGKSRRGASCLYVNKLADVDIDALRKLMEHGYQHMKKEHGST
ncbi:DUF1801 domain-containing protein [Paeniglutamicibacter cryotolerans]|uniref:DUF1801 domain-containing protein n=1 Tax=Paeniglutamicibacter cryotolerans TaxID=670079 RepID=A0A839QFF4_9MICC|nr:DUF1801 domain-containing protein [Paeniglutamicibacter cryotolerans]MBB2994869.1 hypothetical protein [Paeniglutamicibacter cryotolerans]